MTLKKINKMNTIQFLRKCKFMNFKLHLKIFALEKCFTDCVEENIFL